MQARAGVTISRRGGRPNLGRLKLRDYEQLIMVQASRVSDYTRPTRRDLVLAPVVPRINFPESGKGFWVRDSNHS